MTTLPGRWLLRILNAVPTGEGAILAAGSRISSGGVPRDRTQYRGLQPEMGAIKTAVRPAPPESTGILCACTVLEMPQLVLNRRLNYRNVVLTDCPGGEIGYLLRNGERRFVPWLGFIERAAARRLDGARPVRLADIHAGGCRRLAGFGVARCAARRVRARLPDEPRGVRHLRRGGRAGGGRGERGLEEHVDQIEAPAVRRWCSAAPAV